MIKESIEQDLKKAMLAGDKQLVLTLRNLKSAILYAEVAASKQKVGLGDQEIITLLQKESKKRQEAADLYDKAGEAARAKSEKSEKEVIGKYLPEAMGEAAINQLIDKAVNEVGELSKQTMGQVIAFVKKQSGGAADGAQVARLVQKRL